MRGSSMPGRTAWCWAAIARLIVRDLLDVVDPKDRGYFRESREARFGMTLEAVQEGREARVPEFRALR